MPVVNYHTVEGEIQGETTNGVRTDYLTDALGSVVATVNQSAQVVNTYRFKPYGERLAKTGVGADPKFGWAGDTGSRRTARSFADQYNRARHYGQNLAQWTSVDVPIDRPNLSTPYCYVLGSPVTDLDPEGRKPITCNGYAPCDTARLGMLRGCCDNLPVPMTKALLERVKRSVSQKYPGRDWLVEQIVRGIADRCGGNRHFAVSCPGDGPPPTPWPRFCSNPCDGTIWANTIAKAQLPIFALLFALSKQWKRNLYVGDQCWIDVYFPPGAPIGRLCYDLACGTECAIVFCDLLWESAPESVCEALYHELAHCTGVSHGIEGGSLIHAIGDCIARETRR